METNDKILIKVNPTILAGYPVVSLKEINLILPAHHDFSTMFYSRPQGNGKTGKAIIELISSMGHVTSNEITFDFALSENERLEEAKKPAQFKIRPEALISRNFSSIRPLDVKPFYDDVIVDTVSYVPFSKKDSGTLTIKFHFLHDQTLKGRGAKVSTRKTYTVQLPMNESDSEHRLANFSLTGQLNVNVLQNDDQEVVKGLTLTVDKLTKYKIDDAFIMGGPPILPGSNIIIPGPKTLFKRIDYMPPANVDAKSAYLQVEYIDEDDQRTHNERVRFEFAKSIRETVEAIAASIPASDFEYKVDNRRVVPDSISPLDFEYKGTYPLDIVDVNYNYSEIDPDDRVVEFDLVISMRTATTVIKKRVEFFYSKNEYIDGGWMVAKTESGSIDIKKKFRNARMLNKIQQGDKKLHREMVRTATIVEGYPYHTIKDIKIINFSFDSHIVMMKVTALESMGAANVERVFEKHLELSSTYFELNLRNIMPDDVKLEQSIMPLYPPVDLSEKIFMESPDFKILSIQYVRPKYEIKRMEVQIKIVAGSKMRFLTKGIVFKYSKKEHDRHLWEVEAYEYLKSIDPSSLAIKVDLSKQPPTSIVKEDIFGVPPEVDFDIRYQRPKVGSRISRIIIKLKKENISVSYEQTLEFIDARVN